MKKEQEMKKNKIFSWILTLLGMAALGGSACALLNCKERKELNHGERTLNKAKKTFYEKYIKRVIDVVCSLAGLILTAPLMAVVALLIYIEEPGEIIFKQKRVGENKQYFYIHKLRSMKKDTGDIPTHLLSKEEQDAQILKIGHIIRKLSIDELPQFYDIMRGKMSLVGPRPALWNQYDLLEERDKYGANTIRPGLTGWAQINGRDELPIAQKAILDGQYTEKLRKNSFSGLMMDMKCIFSTFKSVLLSKGVVEGGTGGAMETKFCNSLKKAECAQNLDFTESKKILIVGEGSYIGNNFKNYLEKYSNYKTDIVSSMNREWENTDFGKYDVVYDVAGIAHVKETEKNRQLYYEINCNLAFELAQKAKREGCHQFIYLSSMSVYGLAEGKVDKNTETAPKSAYGKSKLQAEELLWKLQDEKFIVAIVRPPMVYGNGCKGNYQLLRKFALKAKVFPNYYNERSMIYIDNLSSAVRGIIHNQKSGLYFPQNKNYCCTYEMVRDISIANKSNFITIRGLNSIINVMASNIQIFQKVFGTLIYEQSMNVPEEWIEIGENRESIFMTEKKKKKALMIASMGSMLDNFNRDNIRILREKGYDITLAANFENEDSNSLQRNIEFRNEMKDDGYKIVQIDFSRNISNIVKQIKSMQQVRELLNNDFDLVHCHSPICAAIVRFFYNKYRKDGKHKLIYTAHGFHFYAGAPKKNWLIYYPIEKIASKWTDILITINKEDYQRAKTNFYAKKIMYLPGVGVDSQKYKEISERDVELLRQELGAGEQQIMLLSVGELSERKNHEVVIRALQGAPNLNVKYYIAGLGHLRDYLEQLIQELNMESQVILLGYRTDVADLYHAADAFIFPSHQEGLSMALMEAVASDIPVLCSNIRGNCDLILDENKLFDEKSVQATRKCILQNFAYKSREQLKEDTKEDVLQNSINLKKYDIKEVSKNMEKIYDSVEMN